MTWRDLDIDVRLDNIPTDGEYLELVSYLFKNKSISRILLVDNRNQIEKNRPKSMYIGPAYIDDEGNSWKIDIRLLSKEETTTDAIEALIKKGSTEQKRLQILQIKERVKDNPNYHKSFSSVDIYKAVIEDNIGTLEDFSMYLETLGKSL